MKKLWVIISVLLWISCQNVEKTNRPERLIPEQKMVEVLTDLSLLNSAKNYNKRQMEETGLRPKEYLYEKHDIDSVRLAESTMFYAQHPAQLERIYTKVKNNLETLKRDLEVIKAEETRIQDSINALEGEVDSLRVKAPDTLEVESTDSLRVSPRVLENRRRDTLGTSPNMSRESVN